MKTTLLFFAMLSLAFNIAAQNAFKDTITFEQLTLDADTFWNGSATSHDTVLEFGESDRFVFFNSYNHDDHYWADGWAYSNKKDSVHAGFGNLYSARSAKGADDSGIYLVGQKNTNIKNVQFNETDASTKILGFYINNGTYAALSMQAGDDYAKKFGGVSGNDADWFKLKIKAFNFLNEKKISDSVDFYLADFRFANNDSDYIVKDWKYVDLSKFASTDSLVFELSSSDNGDWGMNTPAFFCLDNLVYTITGTGVSEYAGATELQAYPNPANEIISIDFKSTVKGILVISDISGKQVYVEVMNASKVSLPVAALEQGVYFITLSGNDFVATTKFIKQ